MEVLMRAARNLIEKDLKWWYWDDISDLTDIQIMIRMDNFANEELYRHATATQRSKIRRMLRPETADERRRRLSTISRDRHNPGRSQEAAAYRGEREVLYEEAMERQAAYLFLQHAHLAVLNKFYIILRIKLSTKNFHSSI